MPYPDDYVAKNAPDAEHVPSSAELAVTAAAPLLEKTRDALVQLIANLHSLNTGWAGDLADQLTTAYDESVLNAMFCWIDNGEFDKAEAEL